MSDPIDDKTHAARPASDPEEIARRHQAARAREQPNQIGPYKILETLGEGGMGMVYLAERTKPIHRRVALKIIKLGMDTKQVIARFETEREALALMNHPNVARVFDAGATETGRPFFVMEYVAGIPITDYCDKHRLTTEERLKLFMQVCHAVQHAHQKGIIHRDIKPSNVLVTVQDGEPTPKVIDFGVAKATQHRLTERTVFTEQGQLIGTPGYMSPEQAEMTSLDIDTRTDIYSLGVLLYELLVGALPFDLESLRQVAFGEIQRIIREVEPPRPSTKLSSFQFESGAAATGHKSEPGAQATGPSKARAKTTSRLDDVARRRRTEPKTLIRQLRGDLDWIIMKAMEKDRIRRYDTANGLALEIERYLNHEPILAHAPSVTYHVGKFVRKHSVGLTAVGLVAFSLGFAIYARVSAREASWSARLQTYRVLFEVKEASLRDRQRVIAECGRLIEDDPRFAPAYAIRGYAFFLKGQDEAAWADCMRAIELDPNNALGQRVKGYLLLQRGDFAGAVAAYDAGIRSLSLDIDYPRDFHNRARAHRMLGHLEAALADHERAVALAPTSGLVYVGRGVTRRMAGDEEGAINDFARAAELDPGWFLQAQQWIWEIRMTRDGSEDREAAAQALERARGRTSNSFEMAMLGVSLGEVTPDEAFAEAKTDRLRSVAHYYVGARFLVEGRRDDARAHFEQCLARGAHDLPEADLARWRLRQLSDK